MRRKLLFTGIISIVLIFMMVLAGCGYDGPSVDEIADAVNGRLNDPSVDEIADAVNDRLNDPNANDIAEIVWEQFELRECAQYLENFTSFGKLTVTNGIQAWDQEDAAYTLTVNTAERTSFYLPEFNYNYVDAILAWEGAGNSDIKRSDDRIIITEKADGKTADFNFTFTNLISAKVIKGVLTVNADYDHSTVGIDNLNEFFVKVLSSFNYSDNTSRLTTSKPFANWGQNDVSYTITAENNVNVCFPTIKVPILFDDYCNWESALVEWKPLTIPAGLTSGFDTESGYVNIKNVSYNYDKSILNLSTELAAEQQVIMNFRITRDDQTISGTVTVKIKKVTPLPPTAAELEKIELQNLQDEFKNIFEPIYHSISSYDTSILTCYVEKGITAFGQTDVSYLITVRGNTGNTDGVDSYSTLYLPNLSGSIAWTTKTSDPSAVLSDSYLCVYNNKSGIAEFNFTYTSPTSSTKTVKGTVKVTVAK